MPAAGVPQRPATLAPGATELVLVRHGATQPALAEAPFALRDGHGDPPLEPEGVRQARRVAVRLAAEGVRALFHTALARTEQTAAPLALATGLGARGVPDLREVRLGDWEGGVFRLRVHAGDPLVARVFAEQRWDVIPGAEGAAALEERVRRGVARVVADAGPGPGVVVVVHGGIVGELCRLACGARPLGLVGADNGSISRLVVGADGAWTLRGFNDVSHLGP